MPEKALGRARRERRLRRLLSRPWRHQRSPTGQDEPPRAGRRGGEDDRRRRGRRSSSRPNVRSSTPWCGEATATGPASSPFPTGTTASPCRGRPSTARCRSACRPSRRCLVGPEGLRHPPGEPALDRAPRRRPRGPGAAVGRDIAERGDTSAASVPPALSRLIGTGRIRTGGPVPPLGLSAGLGYAAQVVKRR
ncbi:3-oxoacyl-[acyl-carrier-protein] synthase III C-terminal domain-containing protein [Streptomyces sp. NPDC006334]|uniref:3-oxoacyl-[acyl-carrier-protein] synthase III C-terminal domain-containing protein n=1 Tax=Streptomyces sp. NPDC006334 TaxID=3156754 RepID=UPI0033B1FB8F